MPAPKKSSLSRASNTTSSRKKRRRLDTPEADMAPLKLPMELVLDIMGHIDSFSDLLNMALTSKAVYEGFVSCKDKYISGTVINRVGRSVFPSALIAMSVPMVVGHPEMGHEDANAIAAKSSHWKDVMEQQKDARWWDRLSLKESDGVLELSHCQHNLCSNTRELMSMQRAIEGLTTHFVEQCAATNEDLAKSLEAMPLKMSERRRIHRVFYHFEMFRRMFIGDNWHSDIYPAFWKNFSGTEISQIGCIRDFLYRSAAKHYNDLAAHDIQLNGWIVRNMCSTKIDYMLKLHLSLANELAGGCDFARKKVILQHDVDVQTNRFIFKALSDGRMRETNLAYGSHRTPLYDDPDIGPDAAWRWCHSRRASTENRLPYSFGDWLARKWGYVMWDESRLDMMGVLERKCPRCRAAERLDTPLTPDEETSWRLLRAKLFYQGYRGRWPREEE